MKRFDLALGTALISGALAAPAMAGSLADPVVTPAPAAPVAVAPVPMNTGGDWTGAYAGLQFGRIDAETSGGAALEGDDTAYGAHVGYDYDFGRFVAGAELDYDATELDLEGAASIDSVTRLKLRGGYDLGRTLVYATAGAARADTSLGDADGTFAGLGVGYKMTDNIVLGGEYLRHNFDDINDTGIDADADTVSLRASFKF